MKRLVIFDMDGTLTDSWPGMQYCYNQTFREFGREDMTEDEFLSGFVGNLTENLRVMLHIDGEELEKAVRIFREHNKEKGHSLSAPFPGMIDLIRELHSEGYAIGIATMIYQPYAVDMLKELKVDDCIDVIEGSDIRGERKKADMIRNCMVATDVDNDNTLMIGDGFNDQKAAEKAKVGFVAAAYGYGITVDNCLEYGYEYASKPEDVRTAIESHWAKSTTV